MVEILGIDETSFVVSLFWPRVGEVDVEAIDGIIWDKFGYKVCGIGANNTNVFYFPSAYAVDGVAVIFIGPLDTEEINLWFGFG